MWRRSERYSDGGVDQNGIGATLRSIIGEGGDAAVDQRGGATLASIIGGGDGGVDHQRGATLRSINGEGRRWRRSSRWLWVSQIVNHGIDGIHREGSGRGWCWTRRRSNGDWGDRAVVSR